MAIHATTTVRFKQTNTGYSLVCSPTQIALDGKGVVRTGYETVTVSVSKSVDGAPTSVIGDSDELAIHVEKVVNSGSGNVTSDVIALADGVLSSSVQSRSFAVGDVTGLVFFVVSLFKKDATGTYVKIGNCFVSPTSDGVNGVDGITYWCTPTSVNMIGTKVGGYYCPQDGVITFRFFARKGNEDLSAEIITSDDVSIPIGWLGSLQGESEAIFDMANGYGTFKIVNTGASLNVQSQTLDVTCRFTDVNDVVYTHVYTIPWHVILNGTKGDTGKTGAMTYCAGAYDPYKNYQATATAHPYVIVEDKSTTPATIGRWRLDDETAVWNGGGTRYPKDYTVKWSQITDLQEIFASVAFVEFGKLASAIFSGDYMLSQWGLDCYADTDLAKIIRVPGMNYQDFKVDDPEGTDTAGWTTDGPDGTDRIHKFVPNIYMNFLTGHTVFNDIVARGRINGESIRHNIAKYSIRAGGGFDEYLEAVESIDYVIIDVFGTTGAPSTLRIVPPSAENKGKEMTIVTNYRGFIAPIQVTYDSSTDVFYDTLRQVSAAQNNIPISDSTDQYERITIISDGDYWQIMEKTHI